MRRGPAMALAGLLLVLSAGCTPSAAPAVVLSTAPGPTPVASRPARVAPTARSTYQSPGDFYLLHNEIYSAGQVPAVPCKLPKIPLQTQKEVQQYANAVLGCLERAWKPVVERADVVYSSTVVYVVDQGWKTGCGIFGKDDEGFYCADAGIYLDWDQFTEESPDDRVWAGVYLQFTMAHEFGHHVQQLTGISSYFDDRWSEASGAARLEQMRRHELQASCFASAFLGANQQTLDLYGERLEAYRDAAYAGDDDAPTVPPDHGSRKSSTAWAQAAFKAKSPSACNTWSVPAKRVT